MDGIYRFVNVAPGTYQVSVELPDGVVNQSPTTSTVTIGPTGGETVSGPTVSQIELAPTSLLVMTDDYLASDYLRRIGANSSTSNNGRQGGSVAFNADGSQSIFIAGEGFEDALFVELALSNSQDSALLTVVEEDGDIITAVLSGGPIPSGF